MLYAVPCPPFNRVHADVDKSLPGVREVGVEGPVHGHLGEETNNTLLVGALDDLLEAGRGGDTESVHSNPPLSLAAGVQQGRLETDLPAVLQIILDGDLNIIRVGPQSVSV